MPASDITIDAAFQHAPSDLTVAVHVPKAFKSAEPFLLCVFLHGLAADSVPIENHIKAAVDQIKNSAANALLVAPRFDRGNDPGKFSLPAGFSNFIAELETALPKLLGDHGLTAAEGELIGARAAREAKLVIVAYSGAWLPLSVILGGLIKTQPERVPMQRIVGIELLDIFHPFLIPKWPNTNVPNADSPIVKWLTSANNQAALVNLFTASEKEEKDKENDTLLNALRPGAKPGQPPWPPGPSMNGGDVCFNCIGTDHFKIPSDGPPVHPVAAFLDLMKARV